MNDEQGSGKTGVVDFGTFGDVRLTIRISPSDLVPVPRAEIVALRALVEEVVGMLSGLYLRAAAPADQLRREAAVGLPLIDEAMARSALLLLFRAAERLQDMDGAPRKAGERDPGA